MRTTSTTNMKIKEKKQKKKKKKEKSVKKIVVVFLVMIIVIIVIPLVLASFRRARERPIVGSKNFSQDKDEDIKLSRIVLQAETKTTEEEEEEEEELMIPRMILTDSSATDDDDDAVVVEEEEEEEEEELMIPRMILTDSSATDDDDDAVVVEEEEEEIETTRTDENEDKRNESKRGEILIKNFEDPATFDARVDIRVEKLTRDDLLDLSEIGRTRDDLVDDGGPAIPRHYICNCCQASARKLQADLLDEELKRARGAKYGRKLSETFYLDAIEKSCDDHSHWHLYSAHVYDNGYHYLSGPLLGNASERGSKPFVRAFSKHRWPKRLRDYCQILVNEFDEDEIYEKHYELQLEKLEHELFMKKEEELEDLKTSEMNEEELLIYKRKKKREEILHPHRRSRSKKNKKFDLARKLCYQSEPAKCTADNEFKKRAFLQLATHEEEQNAKQIIYDNNKKKIDDDDDEL
jgi:hypothetical protein